MKAWDVSDLWARLNTRGLNILETDTAIVAEVVFEWTTASVVASETKIDDLALPFLPSVEVKLKELIDGINGKKDLP